MEQQTSPLDTQSSTDPAHRSSKELSSVLQSRNPYQRQSSHSHLGIQYRRAPSHDIELALDGVEDCQKKTVAGLVITDIAGEDTQSPASTSQEFNGMTSTPGGFTSGIPSPRISRVPVGRKGSKVISNLIVEDTPADQISPTSSPYPSHIGFSDQELLGVPNSQYQSSPELPKFECPTDAAIIECRWSWLSVSIITLAIYSTLVSGAYLSIAIAAPRYGKKVGTDKNMSAATAALLSTFFAKTVELSFVTVFVAFLGQALSRKAFLTRARGGGISIAEMMMRTWIMQPGTLITHAGTAKYAILTFLGIVALLATFMVTFYVTAAEALVTPKLRLGNWEDKVLYGEVAASFANPIFLAQICKSPIPEKNDEDRGQTCLQIEHAGQAYHNYQLYLDGWAENLARGNSSGIKYAARPPPTGLMFDNTKVRGQWITPKDEVLTRRPSGRLVQNLTMAMPHANIYNAARDPVNNILQPDELNQGEGVYTIRASVPAPAVNILCAGVEEEDISSLIFVNGSTNSSIIQPTPYPNATAIDGLFDFGPEMGVDRQYAPIFPKLPMPYNTILNETGIYGDPSLYLLVGAPPEHKSAPYLFCSLKARQYAGCTTQYKAAEAGGEISVHCGDDPGNTIPYQTLDPDAPAGGAWDSEWRNVASMWAQALSLGAGITDANASNARLLTQMIPESSETPSLNVSLNPSLPSIGEALAVLSGCTLELSSMRSPFIHYWNYSADVLVLREPQYQAFNASLRYQDYASGPNERWKGIFYVVLFAVFATNLFCLGYLVWSGRQEGKITDYTEPQNLFALAVNSPPSHALSGACGAGPEGDVLGEKWKVEMQTPANGVLGHPHFYVRCGDEEAHRTSVYGSPPRKRRSKMSLISVDDDFKVIQSPAVKQYRQLAGRRRTFL